MLTGGLRRVHLGDAGVEAGATLLVALGPVDAVALVLTVPASRPPSVLPGRVLPALLAVVLEFRVASARVGTVSVRQKEGIKRARARNYGIFGSHQRPGARG